MTLYRQLFSAASAMVILFVATASTAAPRSNLWERWAQHDPESTLSIDHQVWDRILKRFVIGSEDGINRFAYARVGESERQNLQDYLDAMSGIEISRYNRNEQRAFWINVYNALTVEVILEHYPLQTIRDISSGLFSAGPWGLDLIKIENEDLTLNDIEHRILRPIWQDPRIHYAVNCASLGCPNLMAQAFTAANSEDLMEKAALEFINHPRGAQVIEGELQVSSIYDWFEEDFGGSEAGVIEHLQQYAQGELLASLKKINRIDNDSYDWSINARVQPKPQKSSRRKLGS